jgi:tetratricopeptide (TPR) repeat protein
VGFPAESPHGAIPAAEDDRVKSELAPPSPIAPPSIPSNPTELGIARASAYFERLEPEQAAATLEPALAADPRSAAGWLLMARIRLTLNQAEAALDAANRAVELLPEDPRPLGTASRALTMLGRHDEAITMAYRAVIAEPENPFWHDRAAWALLSADRYLADAEQAARTAVGLDPNEAHYYFTHGVALDALGHTDQARQALLISLRLEPENPVAQHRLATLDGTARNAEPEGRKNGFRLFGRTPKIAGPPKAAAPPKPPAPPKPARLPKEKGRKKGKS